MGLEGTRQISSGWIEPQGDSLSVLSSSVECVAWVHEECIAVLAQAVLDVRVREVNLVE
jgi:hypothetical protein